MATRGESRARRAGHQAVNHIMWFLMGLGELWLSYAREGKAQNALGWVLPGPCPHPHSHVETEAPSEVLRIVRFRPMALILHLHSSREQGPTSRYKERSKVGGTCSQVPCSQGL